MSIETVEPIRFLATRYRCPFCTRSGSSKARTVEHIGRCWRNPAARACKTCVNYEPYESGGGYGPDYPESCCVGVDLTGGIQAHCPTWEHNQDGGS